LNDSGGVLREVDKLLRWPAFSKDRFQPHPSEAMPIGRGAFEIVERSRSVTPTET
jgi:hypothetical protein